MVDREVAIRTLAFVHAVDDGLLFFRQDRVPLVGARRVPAFVSQFCRPVDGPFIGDVQYGPGHREFVSCPFEEEQVPCKRYSFRVFILRFIWRFLPLFLQSAGLVLAHSYRGVSAFAHGVNACFLYALRFRVWEHCVVECDHGHVVEGGEQVAIASDLYLFCVFTKCGRSRACHSSGPFGVRSILCC